MVQYQVQQGDTIAAVTRRLNTDWQTLRRSNPEAIGRLSGNGRWFLKQGATIKVGEEPFHETLEKARDQGEQNTPRPEIRATAPDTPAEFAEYTIQPGDTLWALAVTRFHTNVEDIIRDNNITDPRSLQPGQKIRIRVPDHSREQQQVVASWYGEKYHGRPMANGQKYNMYANTIAHRDLPFGTRVELKNPETGQTVKAVVTDRGPFIEGRDIDLSYGLARKLSMVQKGVGTLIMRVL
jgi:rare lipoprotein A